MPYFLGVDIGTQSARVALIDECGVVHTSYSEAYPLHTPRHGWAEQDPEDWWQAALRGIREVMAFCGCRAGDILGVAVDSQMHATIPVDRRGALLSHAVQLWCDKRGSNLVNEFLSRPEAMPAARLAGNPPLGCWIGFKIKWLKEHQPELYASAWKFLTGSGFVNHRLTGELSIDWTEASGTFLMDAGNDQWSPELAEMLEVDLYKMPPIFRSADFVGRVTKEAAQITGLAEGTPVAAGGGDMLIMLLASALSEPGKGMDVTGTATNIVFYTDKPVIDTRITNLHHPMPGWCPFGTTESGGGSYRWLKDTLIDAGCFSQATASQDIYASLNKRSAEVSPGSEGLLYFPYLMGERALGTPNARGAFIGLTPRHGVAAMTRAIMEGVAFEMRRTLEIVQTAGNRVDQIIHTGGGARSALWSQIKADIYQKPVLTLAEEEGGVLGSAMLAMTAAGVYPDLSSAVEACVKLGATYQPNPVNFARYNYIFEIFKDIHDRLVEPYNRLAGMP